VPAIICPTGSGSSTRAYNRAGTVSGLRHDDLSNDNGPPRGGPPLSFPLLAKLVLNPVLLPLTKGLRKLAKFGLPGPSRRVV